MYTEKTNIINGAVHCPYCDSEHIRTLPTYGASATQRTGRNLHQKYRWYSGNIQLGTPVDKDMQCLACGQIFDNPFLDD